jgi:rubredoxin
MANDERDRWIEAAKAAVDVSARITCPRCRKGMLLIEDERVDATHQDRHLRCPDCGAHESIFMRIVG